MTTNSQYPDAAIGEVNYGAIEPSRDSMAAIGIGQDTPSPHRRTGMTWPDVGTSNPHRQYFWTSLLAFMCFSIGAGQIGLPSALAKGGWASLPLMVIVCVMNMIASYMLLHCMHYIGATHFTSYEQMAGQLAGRWCHYTVKAGLAANCIGSAVVYMILIGTTMEKMVMGYDPDFRLSARSYTLISAALVWPLCCQPTVKESLYHMLFGLAAALCVSGVLVKVAFDGTADFLPQGPRALSEKHSTIRPKTILNAFAMMMFSEGASSLIPSFARHMKNVPQNAPRFVAFSLPPMTALYMLIMVAGYYSFGESLLLESGNLLSVASLASGTAPDVWITGASVFLVAHFLVALYCPIIPVANMCEEAAGFEHGMESHTFLRIMSRGALLGIITVIAVLVPYFDDVSEITSSMSIVANTFIVPPLLYYKCFGDKMNMATKGGLVIMGCIGLLGAVGGTVSSVVGLVGHVQERGNPFTGFFWVPHVTTLSIT